MLQQWNLYFFLYITFIRHTTEYTCPIFNNILPKFLSNDLERLQKRALRIIFPSASYSDALEASNLIPLCDRKEALASELSVKKDVTILTINCIIYYPSTMKVL